MRQPNINMTAESHHLRPTKSWFCTAALVAITLAPSLHAAAFEQKGPEGKAYASSVVGQASIEIRGKVDALKPNAVYQATGTAIVTQAKAGVTVVMANGTRLFITQSSRVETKQFSQDPFIPGPNDSMVEPSPSQNLIYLVNGSAAIDTAKLSPETVMMFTSPNTNVNIEGGKVVIVTSPDGKKTFVNVLQGSAIVQGAIDSKSYGDSYVVKTGQQAAITTQVKAGSPTAGSAANGDAPAVGTTTQISANVKVLIQPIPDHEAYGLIGAMNMAITGGRSVYVDTNENYLTSQTTTSPTTAGQLIAVTGSGQGAANPALTGALDGHSFDWPSVDWNNLGSTGLSSLPYEVNAPGTSTTTTSSGQSSPASNFNNVFSDTTTSTGSNPASSSGGNGTNGSGNTTTPSSILDLPNIPSVSPSSL